MFIIDSSCHKQHQNLYHAQQLSAPRMHFVYSARNIRIINACKTRATLSALRRSGSPPTSTGTRAVTHRTIRCSPGTCALCVSALCAITIHTYNMLCE